MKVEKVELGVIHPMSETPENDGYYVVFSIFDDNVSYLSTLKYLVGYGWNCHKLYSGEIATEHRMFTEDDDNSSYFWTTSHVTFGDDEEASDE